MTRDKPETATNTSNAVWTSLTIASSYGGSDTRNAFLPLAPELFDYDLDGNLLSDGRWDYTYDAENRLVTMQTRSDVIDPNHGPIPNAEARRLEFKYDYLGRRVQKTVRGGWNGSSYTTVISDTRNLYNGWNLLHEFSVSGTTLTKVRSSIWGLDWSGTLQGAGGVGGLLYHNDLAAGVTMLPAYDGSGNVAAMLKRSDGSGMIVAAYEYDAFGNTLRATGPQAQANPFRFSTKYTDVETGLIYHDTRYYSPSLGRFINRDSIGEQGGLNLYAYVSNRVPNAFDYLGMNEGSYWYTTGPNGEALHLWPHITVNTGSLEDWGSQFQDNHSKTISYTFAAFDPETGGMTATESIDLHRDYFQSWGRQNGWRTGDLVDPFVLQAESLNAQQKAEDAYQTKSQATKAFSKSVAPNSGGTGNALIDAKLSAGIYDKNFTGTDG